MRPVCWSVIFCSCSSARLAWSSGISPSFSCCCTRCTSSRRTLRTATRASSALERTIFTYSRRRSSVSGGMGTRTTWPSLAGLRPWPQPRFRRADLGELVERGRGAVVGHRDLVDQGRVGAPGADVRQLGLQVLGGLVHPDLGFHYDLFVHDFAPTSVP